MKLIDADRLKKEIHMLYSDDLGIQEVVDNQPTIYSVDKVVKQLETESDRWKESGEEYEDQKELGISEGFKKAIEVVKSGGIG